MGMLTYVTLAAASAGCVWKDPIIYDMTGRRGRGPVEVLATGVYILRWGGLTKKVFVQ